MLPTAQDRATNDGSAPVHVGSGGAVNGDSATANAFRSVDGTVETGGRMAHSNQQVPEGMEPKQLHPKETGAAGAAASGGEGLKQHGPA
ncbi:hypothetical protein JCM10213_008676 [Rhodosporidiobolus nylandii]